MSEQLNLDPLKKALQQLEAGLKEVKNTPADELRRDGVIQRFEYSMDLAWKSIQRYLKVIAQADEATIRTKKDLFREAARLKLIASAEDWIAHYEARNETTHVYNMATAVAVFERASLFLPDAKALVESLNNAT
jgi:nucleotidyltransferase substrate binding protein (TIGR01987 family)